MRNLKSSKLLLISSFITLSCSSAFATLAPNSLLTDGNAPDVIHVTTVHTAPDKTVLGKVSAGLGKGDGINCQVSHSFGPFDFTIKNKLKAKLTNGFLMGYGTDLTCAIERWTSADGTSILIGYNFKYNKAHDRYEYATPFENRISVN